MIVGQSPIWGIIFSGALHAAPQAMHEQVVIGPFPNERVCASTMALLILDPKDGLNSKHPMKDFSAQCGNGPRRTGWELYTISTGERP